MELILASGSPRRKELLERVGVPFVVRPADIEEVVAPGLTPQETVISLSAQKAQAVAALSGERDLILAADTVVVLDNAILGKPHSEEEAARMLRALAGRAHVVCTGLTLRQGDKALSLCEESEVTFRPLTDEEIAAYVATGEPMDKAGAYGIQGYGSLLVTGIRGDYFNVMGLPLCRLGMALRDFGVDLLVPHKE